MPSFSVKVIGNQCKGCGLCAHVCKQDCLEVSDTVNDYGYQIIFQKINSTCTGCGYCYLMCPEGAVEIYK
jgi:2-oxoglutarate ferredoxin oxidoreductase subunit delta